LSHQSIVLQNGISWILRAGVGASLFLESLGILLNYVRTGESSLVLAPSWIAGGGTFFGFASNSITSVLSGATPLGIMALGVAVLMLTPYARIIAAVIYYAVEKDWKYVGITFFVFLVITFGLVLL
jgi:uncharacterized membrane protein